MLKVCAFLWVILLYSLPTWAKNTLNDENFSHLPNLSEVSLSPNGKKLVFLKRLDDKNRGTGVYVLDLDTGKSFSPIYATNEKFLINWVRWANDDQLLLSAVYPSQRYGVKTTESRLLKINAITGKKQSAYNRSFLKRLKFVPQFQDRVIDWLPDDDEHVLINFAGNTSLKSRVLKLNLNKGTAKQVQGSTSDVISWKTDRQGRIRVAVKLRKKSYDVLVRKNPNSKKWTKLWTFGVFSNEQVWPVGFDHDPSILYLQAYHHDKLAIFKFDLSSAIVDKKLVLHDEHYDVDGGLIYSDKSKKVVGVTYAQASGFTFWEPSYKA